MKNNRSWKESLSPVGFFQKSCRIWVGQVRMVSLRPSWLGLREGGEEIISKKRRRGVVLVIEYQKCLA